MTELWQDMTTGFGLALMTYVGTNLDNFVALLGLAANTRRTRPIVVGFGIAALVVLAAIASFSLLNLLVPAGSLRYLGIIPIAIGVRLLLQANTAAANARQTQLTATSVATVLALNSVDSIATFGPLYAESESAVRIAIVVGFLTAAAATLWAVFNASRSASKRLADSKIGLLLAPLMMIGIGCYILLNTGTDLEIGP